MQEDEGSSDKPALQRLDDEDELEKILIQHDIAKIQEPWMIQRKKFVSPCISQETVNFNSQKSKSSKGKDSLKKRKEVR